MVRAAVVELAPVDQFKAAVEEVDVRGAGGIIGPATSWDSSQEIGKWVAATFLFPDYVLRVVVRKPLGVVAVDGDEADAPVHVCTGSFD